MKDISLNINKRLGPLIWDQIGVRYFTTHLFYYRYFIISNNSIKIVVYDLDILISLIRLPITYLRILGANRTEDLLVFATSVCLVYFHNRPFGKIWHFIWFLFSSVSNWFLWFRENIFKLNYRMLSCMHLLCGLSGDRPYFQRESTNFWNGYTWLLSIEGSLACPAYVCMECPSMWFSKDS